MKNKKSNKIKMIPIPQQKHEGVMKLPCVALILATLIAVATAQAAGGGATAGDTWMFARVGRVPGPGARA